jgi:hypothetical protein
MLDARPVINILDDSIIEKSEEREKGPLTLGAPKA